MLRLRALPVLALFVVALAAPGSASAALAPGNCPGGQAIEPDRVITGEFGRELQGSYVLVPFDVPAGTTQVRVKYCWDQPEVRGSVSNTIDLGLYEPRRAGRTLWGEPEFRGWGGSSHPDVSITPQGFSSEEQYRAAPRAHVPGRTTRGFLPGPIRPGTWAAELGVAAVAAREQGNTDEKVQWRVEIELREDPSFAAEPYRPAPYDSRPARRGAGWYAGDLHVHGEHSALGDATMTEVFDFAFKPIAQGGAGLDFITLSDYVTTSGWGEIGRHQARHRGNLVARSSEIITYRGHTNNHGSARYVDYRTGPIYELRPGGGVTLRRGARPARELFAGVRAGNGWTQINHPTIFPSSVPGFAQLCRGCPWDYSVEDTNYDLVDAIEVNTGPAGFSSDTGETGPNPFTLTAIDFYEQALARGARIAAVGVSDSHHAGRRPNPVTQTPIGDATTVVYAPELSERGIEIGVRQRRTYVKLFGNDGPDLRFEAQPAGGGPAAMIGDAIPATTAAFEARVLNAPSSTEPRQLLVVKDGRVLRTLPVSGRDSTFRFASAGAGRYRLQLMRGQAVEAVSSPIWLGVRETEDPAADPNPPSVRLTFARRGWVRDATFKVRCKVAGGGTQRCDVDAHGPGGALVGSGAASGAGRAPTVAVRLTKAGRALLARAGARGMLVRLSASGSSDLGTGDTRRWVRLRPVGR